MSLTLPARRWLAGSFAFCSFATLTLLANHPAGGGHTIVELMRAEASHQLADALVHGGFILTLSALIVCFVFLSRELGLGRVPAVIGLVTFSIGCGALMASMILDGLVIPALAQRFTATSGSDTLIQASTLFIFAGTVIRFLMPMGLLFQAVAILSWSVLLAGPLVGRLERPLEGRLVGSLERPLEGRLAGRRGCRLAAGVFGMSTGALVIGAILLAPPRLGDHVTMGAIALISAWYLALAGALCVRNGWPVPPLE